MYLDGDARDAFKRKLSELVEQNVQGLVTGKFADIAAVERQRGVIVGIGIALDVLDDKPPQQEQQEESDG